MVDTKPLFISVNGTGVPDPWGPGFAGDIGRCLTNVWRDPIGAQFWGQGFANLWDWQPIGYPAAVFPMGASVTAGVQEVSRQFGVHENPDPNVNLGGYSPPGTPVSLSGYSQGAIVIATFWRDYVLSPTGLHHNRLPDIKAIFQFGDPMRCPGIANGNELCGLPMPKTLDSQVTGGIAGPGCLTPAQTPSFYYSCALDGDLYASAPVGLTPWSTESTVGILETRIYDFVLNGTFDSFMQNVDDLALLFKIPVATVIAAGQAIFNGLQFAAEGTSAPHWQYQVFFPAVSDYLISLIPEFS